MNENTLIQPAETREKRLVIPLRKHWDRMRGSKDLPRVSDLKAPGIEALKQMLFAIKVSEYEDEHRFAYFGPGLVEVFGRDYTHCYLESGMRDIMMNNMTGYYDKVIKDSTPQTEEAVFYRDCHELRSRSILLPCSQDGKTVDYIIGTANYKDFG